MLVHCSIVRHFASRKQEAWEQVKVYSHWLLHTDTFWLFQSQYEHHKEVVAAQGCKIIAKDLEKALAGLPLYIAPEPDEAEIYKVAFVLISLKVIF